MMVVFTEAQTNSAITNVDHTFSPSSVVDDKICETPQVYSSLLGTGQHDYMLILQQSTGFHNTHDLFKKKSSISKKSSSKVNHVEHRVSSRKLKREQGFTSDQYVTNRTQITKSANEVANRNSGGLDDVIDGGDKVGDMINQVKISFQENIQVMNDLYFGLDSHNFISLDSPSA